MKTRILLLDDDIKSGLLLKKNIETFGKTNLGTIECHQVTDYNSAMNLILKTSFDIALLDVDLSENTTMNGIAFLKHLKSHSPFTIPIMLTGRDDKDTIDAAFKVGARDYCIKPTDINILIAKIQIARTTSNLEKQKVFRKQSGEYSSLDLLEKMPSDGIRNIVKEIKKLNNTDISVLITGDSGVGKELISHALWEQENDLTRPFISTNCAHFRGDTLRSELFGHIKGSFTGALNDKLGLFELADGGDIFLDEIHEIPLDTQPQLLRALNNGEITKLGDSKTKTCTFRVIAATNTNIKGLVEQSVFKADLYYRFRQFTIDVPSLNQRRVDIPILAKHCLENFSIRNESKTLSSSALEILMETDYNDGNIRKLFSIIRASAIREDQTEIQADTVIKEIQKDKMNNTPKLDIEYFRGNYSDKIQTIEKEIIQNTYKKFGTLQSAAEYLGMSKSTFQTKLNKFTLN